MPDGGSVETLSEVGQPLASSVAGSVDDIRVVVASSTDDLMRCMVVRGAVWLGEDEAKDHTPYSALFDANDISGSTHLLVYVGDEPAGTMRMRWHPGFVRFERLAVRTRFRSFRLFRRLARFAFDLAAARGFRHANALARLGTEKQWQFLGARAVGPLMKFHGEQAYPMVFDLPGAPHPALVDGLAGAGRLEFEEAMGCSDMKLMGAA